MALAVSLLLEFKSPIGNMDCFDKMKVISQGLGLATPARAAVKRVGSHTISVSKMTYNKLTKLLRPEDAATQDILARYEINELFMISKEPSTKTSQLQYGQPDPALENPPHKPCVVEVPNKAPSPQRSYAPPTSSVATKQLTALSKRSTPDETGHNDYPSKRLKTMHSPEKEVEYLLCSLLEKVADLEVANERETKRLSKQGEIFQLETKLANEEQEAKLVTQIEESRRLLSGIVSEIRTRLLAKEKELYSITEALNEEKVQNTLLLKELNKKNDASELHVLKNNERSARETIEDLQQKLKSEHDLRLKAEKLVYDVRRELKFPFIVPSLLDAFIIFSESNVQIPATFSTDSG